MIFDNNQQKSDVFTPLGRGRIVHVFPDGTFAVELAHGGGHVFRPEELFQPVRKRLRSDGANRDQQEGIN